MRMVRPVARNRHGVSGRGAGRNRPTPAHAGGRPGAGCFAGFGGETSRVRSASRGPRPETPAVFRRVSPTSQMVSRTIAGFTQLPARNRDGARQGRVGGLVSAAAAHSSAPNPIYRTEIAPALDFNLGSLSVLDCVRGIGDGCRL